MRTGDAVGTGDPADDATPAKARHRRRHRPWWVVSLAYALGAIAYVGLNLPSAGQAEQSVSSGRRRPDSIRFSAVGDIGMGKGAGRLLEGIGRTNTDFFLPLGDFSYGGPESEQAWCRLVRDGVGGTTPVQLVAGNHEDDTGTDGSIAEFAGCLPDRMLSEGSYPAQYFFQMDRQVRLIVVSPDLDIGGHHYFYGGGSPDELWLRKAIADARSMGTRWIIVAMHKPCISMGEYSCEIQAELLNLLVSERVDLVLQAHDHSYQRTAQLALSPSCTAVPLESFDRDCVVDDGKDGRYRKDAGPVFVVAGSATGNLYNLHPEDSDRLYMARTMGANDHPTSGFLDVEVSDNRLWGRFVKTSGPADFSDRFEIRAR